MRRTYLIAAVALLLSALIFVYGQTPRRTTQMPQARATSEAVTMERVVSTQQRINRYFHGEVMSKLQKCWGSVHGKGAISLKYTYTKTGTRWIFSRLETDHSTLQSGQNAIALNCMSDAVRGSSFAAEGLESTERVFVINWTWPVPFPLNASQLTTGMFAARPGQSNEGGCDGFGTPAKCFTCGAGGCIKVCVGHSECTVYSGSGDSHLDCFAKNDCASGGPFGVSGSGVIY